jgi:transcriptional regulator of arginine metabolism
MNTGDFMRTSGEILEKEIIRIIKENNITEQAELLSKLQEIGITIPQPTLSRRLKKLEIVKIHDNYQLLRNNKPNIPLLDIKISLPNLIVLHTLPGHANSIAYQLDLKMREAKNLDNDIYKGLCGTIAGDDTILLIAENEIYLRKLEEVIRIEYM